MSTRTTATIDASETTSMTGMTEGPAVTERGKTELKVSPFESDLAPIVIS